VEELRWKTSVSATCLHMAMCRAAHLPPADAQSSGDTERWLDALVAEITAIGWPPFAVLHEMTSLTVDIGNNRNLVDRVASQLQLSAGDAAARARVAGAIADVETAVARLQPDLVSELESRVRPLREHWEARGPGILAEMRRLTDPVALPEAADVVLVAPHIGGYGAAHPRQNRVLLEAVLYHPLPQLPETLRLAWLLGQLNSDLPAIADALPAGRGFSAVKLAMIAPVLAAAEVVELGRCDEATIAVALGSWQPELKDTALPAKLWAWWNTWLDRPAKWPVAVAALDQLAG
jgi:hypothetical protein